LLNFSERANELALVANGRFSEEFMKIFEPSRHSLSPGSKSFLNGDVLAPVASNYKANTNDVIKPGAATVTKND